ncbi:alanine racemase, partial [Gordonia sp. (in: high G+C Gram-positive bacteria)]|uniref:alanine racemase n=1 Tax=Gordonia sp. (in: high G+C Gram-positive bacteria) TaxID=84139 RepID=UPI0039E22FC0
MTAHPQLRLSLASLTSNIEATARWCADAGVELWPHIKTTMCRPIVERQLAAGASAVTVATPAQAATAAAWGCERILIANEVIGALPQVCAVADTTTVMVLVDSAAGVTAADAAARTAGVDLDVLIDVGRPGGRTGVRDGRQAVDLAQRVRAARTLR